VFAQTAGPQVRKHGLGSIYWHICKLPLLDADQAPFWHGTAHCNCLFVNQFLCFSSQLIANLAEQGIGGIKPEARDETRGLPLSDSRYPAGSTIAGDETKIR